MSFVQGDGTDLDTNMGPTQKGGALWNAIFLLGNSKWALWCVFIYDENEPPTPSLFALNQMSRTMSTIKY